MCFVLAWRIGFTESKTVLRLSHQTRGGLASGICNSLNNDLNHVILATKLARLQYSALVLDLEIVCYFLDCQDIKFGCKNTQWREVARLSSKSYAQSTWQNPTKSRLEDFFKCKPCCKVPCKYLKIRFTTFQCSSVGFYINWHILFTLKEISGLVIVTYWRARPPLYFDNHINPPQDHHL